MHVVIAYLWRRGKRSRHYRRMRTRNFTYLVRGPWNGNVDGLTHRHSATSTDRIVDTHKRPWSARPQTNTSKDRKVDRPKRRLIHFHKKELQWNYHKRNDHTFRLGLLIIGQNRTYSDLLKRRRTETPTLRPKQNESSISAKETSSLRNVDRLKHSKCRHLKPSTAPNVDKPKRPHTKSSADRNTKILHIKWSQTYSV